MNNRVATILRKFAKYNGFNIREVRKNYLLLPKEERKSVLASMIKKEKLDAVQVHPSQRV